MYISYIVLCDIYIIKLMYVYVQTLIMLLRLGMHTKYINKNKTKTNKNSLENKFISTHEKYMHTRTYIDMVYHLFHF